MTQRTKGEQKTTEQQKEKKDTKSGAQRNGGGRGSSKGRAKSSENKAVPGSAINGSTNTGAQTSAKSGDGKSAAKGEQRRRTNAKDSRAQGQAKGRRLQGKNGETVKIIPLGGVGEVGKNMTVIETKDDIVVIDCGLVFPREDMLGVDYAIPDTTYLKENKHKIRAFVLTHGHEDHIGATPYVLKDYNVPVFGTRLAMALVEAKFEEHRLPTHNLHPVKAGDTIKCGEMSVEFIHVTHSIDDSAGLAITTPAGLIVHTGDFKIDYTPTNGRVIDLARFSALGQSGVLALMSDSTNAEHPGHTISERKVGATFEEYFGSAKGRLFIATFASNINRQQQVIDLAKKYNRKVCFAGRSMVKLSGIATELGMMDVPEKMIVSPEALDSERDNKIVVLTTGSQGEAMSGLVRMASGEHKHINIRQGDCVIISATPIPGNERYVSDVINMLYKRGAKVVYEGLAKVHVSGHACQEELKLMLSIVKPKYFIPVHGEPRHLYHHASLAEDLGIKRQNVLIPELGRVMEFSENKAAYGEHVESGAVLIDGLGVGDVGSVVLRDRQVLASDGLFVVVVTISRDMGEIVSGPDIVSRGFVYMRESEDLLARAKDLVVSAVNDSVYDGKIEWMTIKSKVKRSLSDYLYRQTKRNPMILPIIIEV